MPIGGRFVQVVAHDVYYPNAKSPMRIEVIMAEVKGNLHISNDVIGEIVGSAVIDCYGVVGMSDAQGSSSTIKLLNPTRARKGVAVSAGDEGVNIDIYVVLKYGVNIAVVTQNIRDRVTFLLDTYVQVPVESIDVHVTGIKVRG